MTKPIQVGDLVRTARFDYRTASIAVGKHLWLVIGVGRTAGAGYTGIHAECRYLMIARGSSTMQVFEDDLKKVSE